MPINTPVMLAPISLEMEHMAELLAAEEPELLQLIVHALQVKLECSVNTCDLTIGRYERIYNQPAGGKTLEERRAAIVFLINSRLLVTKEYMEKLIGDVLGCYCWMEEFFSRYSFVMNIDGEGRSSPDFAAAQRYMNLLKPAHLQGTMRYHQTIKGKTTTRAFAGVGLYIKVEPYQLEDLQAEAKLKPVLFTKQGINLRILPKGD